MKSGCDSDIGWWGIRRGVRRYARRGVRSRGVRSRGVRSTRWLSARADTGAGASDGVGTDARGRAGCVRAGSASMLTVKGLAEGEGAARRDGMGRAGLSGVEQVNRERVRAVERKMQAADRR
jgi:hypothetical protein